MIDLYYWTTSNGQKITIFLEEAGLRYNLIPVNIGEGEQFKLEFQAISLGNRIPAIVDHAPVEGGKPRALFESGAILLYLADKTGKFIPRDRRSRDEAIQWLFWQVGHLGPMSAQNSHFRNKAEERQPYTIRRFGAEINRLYGVLNRRLATSPHLAGDYSIADMACYPFITLWERQGQEISEFPYLEAWFEAIKARPAVIRAYDWTIKITAGADKAGNSKRNGAVSARTEHSGVSNASTSEKLP